MKLQLLESEKTTSARTLDIAKEIIKIKIQQLKSAAIEKVDDGFLVYSKKGSQKVIIKSAPTIENATEIIKEFFN